MEKNTYVTKKEALNILGICESTLRYYIDKRVISSYKRLGQLVFLRSEVDELNEVRLDIKREEKAIEEYKASLPTFKKGESLFITSACKEFIELTKLVDILPKNTERERFVHNIFTRCIETKSFEEVAIEVGLTRNRVRGIFQMQVRRYKYRALRMKEIFDEHERIREENEKLRLEIEVTRKIQTKFNNKESIELASALNRNNKKSLCDFDLSIRCLNVLKAADITTLGELLQYHRNDLLRFRNFGKKSLIELDDLLENLGLSFRNYED